MNSATIQPYVNNYPVKYFGLSCGTGSAFDLAPHVAISCGRHSFAGGIIVDNKYCIPESAVLKMSFSPKYNFYSASPTPISVVGNTVTWNLATLSATSENTLISFHLEVPGTLWLIPGDTVKSSFYVSSVTGDVDTTNNIIIRNDTVVSSYDPNEISVSPQGNILECTTLNYAINFENTGNGVAQNISVLDTLSDNLDPHSLSIEIASAAMNISIVNDGIHNIAKFDFPDINLLDSSHHGQCDGMLLFHIKTKSGLLDGTTILNHAGIFFDDNPAVLTNTVANTIGIAPITGPLNDCIGANITLIDATAGGVWNSSNTTASIAGGLLTGVATGIDTISYTVSNACISETKTKIVTINTLPVVGAISGLGSVVCVGSTITLTDTTTGGVWNSSNPSVASVASGVVSGVSAGAISISYSATNICGTASVSTGITVDPVVTPSVSISTNPVDTFCSGTQTTFTANAINSGTTPSYQWKVNGTNVGTGSSYNYFSVNRDIISVLMNSSANCAVPDTAGNFIALSVSAPLIPTINIVSNQGLTIEPGQTDTLIAAVTSGGPNPTYQWYVNRLAIPGATSSVFIKSDYFNNDSVSCFVTSSGECGGLSSFNAIIIQLRNTGITSPQPSPKERVMLRLYPNPAHNELTIEHAEGSRVTIFNLLGQQVYKAENISNKEVLKTDSLIPGTYIVQVIGNNGDTGNVRLVKE